SIRFPSGDPLSRPGSQTKSWSWTPSANTDLSCKSSSTRERLVLPPGVNKASGLKGALEDLGLSAHNVVSVGDAENDHAFLQASGYAVAVANALPSIKDEADLVTKAARGAGVAELIEAVIKDDVEAFHARETHNNVEVGVDADGRPIVIRPHGGSALICGSSGGGKSTGATALLERIVDGGYQICVLG